MAWQIQKSNMFGGLPLASSSWEDDIVTHSPAIVGVHSVTIRYSDVVYNLQITYLLADKSTYTAPSHGGSGGTGTSFTLQENEFIARIEGKMNGASVVLDQVTFFTKKADGTSNQYGPYGTLGATSFQLEGYVLGFFGTTGMSGLRGTVVDGLGAYYLDPVNKSPQYGGSGGTAFADPVESIVPPIIGIKTLNIRHGAKVDEIQVEYVQFGGGSYSGRSHGGGGGSPTTVNFDDGEVIVQMSGKTNNTLIDQVTFITKKSDGRTATYGPFGKTGESPFEVNGKIVGFYGRSGNLLDALGAFYLV